MALGVIGEYLGRIYRICEESKRRPVYLVPPFLFHRKARSLVEEL
ncbi:MAG: hypothetical protein ACYDCX_07450 [Acidithiobacillus sp.]